MYPEPGMFCVVRLGGGGFSFCVCYVMVGVYVFDFIFKGVFGVVVVRGVFVVGSDVEVVWWVVVYVRVPVVWGVSVPEVVSVGRDSFADVVF